MYCWENTLSKLVFLNRKLEMKYIKRAAIIKAFNVTIYFISQLLIAIVIFIPYYYFHGHLKPSIVFSILTFFGSLKFS